MTDPFKMAVLQNLYCFNKHEFDEDTVKYAKKHLIDMNMSKGQTLLLTWTC